MKKNLVIVTILIVGAIGAAFFILKPSPKPASDGHTDHTHDEESAHQMNKDHMINTSSGAVLAGTRVVLKNGILKQGSQNISFELYGKDGHVFTAAELKIAHEKKMHFIVASSDFSDYQHVHPEFKDKLWQVQLAFKKNTSYQAYIDIESDKDGAEILRIPLSVGTPQPISKVSQKETTVSKDGIEVKMNAENGFVSGAENSVTFTLSKNGRPIVPENYLGAKGHVVALGDDPNTFIHGHPDDHGDSEIHFAFTFEKVGIYTLFAQFQVEGVVRTYPFTVSVINGTGSTKESTPHIDTIPHN
jgi:hypothetical protein